VRLGEASLMPLRNNLATPNRAWIVSAEACRQAARPPGRESLSITDGRGRGEPIHFSIGRVGPPRRVGASLLTCPGTPHTHSRAEPVAQLVEHLTFNQVVLGSSPSGLTKYISNSNGLRIAANATKTVSLLFWGSSLQTPFSRRSRTPAGLRIAGSPCQ
jgi:hypothetical protein